MTLNYTNVATYFVLQDYPKWKIDIIFQFSPKKSDDNENTQTHLFLDMMEINLG